LGERDKPSHLPDEQAPARVALRYLKNRSDQLDYPAALAAKLPIGSGLIESGNRHVLQPRFKQAGAWWLPENLNAMACLRSTCASGTFHAYRIKTNPGAALPLLRSAFAQAQPTSITPRFRNCGNAG